MDIGLWIDDSRPLPAVIAEVERAAELGYARAWFGQYAGWDPLTAIAAVGDRAPGIGLATAVVQTWPRHPLTLAAQALTAQAATGGRLTLGIGAGHQVMVENRFGYRWERPARHVHDYLDVLRPALDGAEVDVRAETVTAAGAVTAPGAAAPPVLLAAHGPRMLRLARDHADGVLTTWVGPRALAEHVIPTVRPGSQVVVGVVASLTSDPEAAREFVAEHMAMVGHLPTYRRTLDRDGHRGPADVIMAGDEAELTAAARQYADAGATELQIYAVGPPADRDRTVAFFGDLASS